MFYSSLFVEHKGFTLVEMMVSMLIFSIIVGVVTGLFVSAIRLQKYNLAYQQLLNQTSYAMEYMARAIRMARKDDGTCGFSGKNYQWTDNSIEFQTYDGECQTFYLDLGNGLIKATKTGENGYNDIPLTSDNFRVKSLNFKVSGDDPGDGFQPRVTIFIEIEGRGRSPQPRIEIQTTISQRNFDI